MNDFMDFLGYLYVTGLLDEDETKQDNEFNEERDSDTEDEEI